MYVSRYTQFHVFCTVHCNIIVQYKPTKLYRVNKLYQLPRSQYRTHSSTYKTANVFACTTFHTVPVYTTFFLNTNPRVRNMYKTSENWKLKY